MISSVKNKFIFRYLYIGMNDVMMKGFRSLINSVLTTMISILGFIMPVLGQNREHDIVGGVSCPADKLGIISPLIALAGLIIVASVVIAKRIRKK